MRQRAQLMALTFNVEAAFTFYGLQGLLSVTICLIDTSAFLIVEISKSQHKQLVWHFHKFHRFVSLIFCLDIWAVFTWEVKETSLSYLSFLIPKPCT